MPWAPKRPCPEPGCPTLVTRGRCAAHTRSTQQAVDLARGTAAQRGYGAHHRRWRTRILARDPLCRDPFRRHLLQLVPSTVADHIVPLTQGGDWSERNGQGLCHTCHQIKRQRESMHARPRPPGGAGNV